MPDDQAYLFGIPVSDSTADRWEEVTQITLLAKVVWITAGLLLALAAITAGVIVAYT